MRLEGTYTLDAPRDRVWELLNDPHVLARCTPGMKQLEPAEGDTYKATMEVGVGPVKGTFQGKVEVAERRAPEQITLRVQGGGSAGMVRAEGTITLREVDGRTVLSYTGEAQVSGLIASVGQRMIGSVAKMLADQFFSNLIKEVSTSR